MIHIALLALALALGGGAPRWGVLVDALSGGWTAAAQEAGNRYDPNGVAAPADAGNHLDPNGEAVDGDAGGRFDPDGVAADTDAGGHLDPNG